MVIKIRSSDMLLRGILTAATVIKRRLGSIILDWFWFQGTGLASVKRRLDALGWPKCDLTKIVFFLVGTVKWLEMLEIQFLSF